MESDNWVETWEMLLTDHGDVWDLLVSQPGSLQAVISAESADSTKTQVRIHLKLNCS